jgi:hypothetical protein
MKRRFANKVILFQETLKYQDAINLCYGRQETMELHHASDAHIWAICKVIMEIIYDSYCETMYL